MTHFAEVPCVYQVDNLETALRLQDLHCWSEETVRSRFAYREPGLFVLPVRVCGMPPRHELVEKADYAGCRSWVELEQALSTEGAAPVLDNASFHTVLRLLDVRLGSRT